MFTAVVGGVFALLGTLLGSLVSWHLQRQDRAVQRMEHLGDVRREKAEELLGEVAKAVADANAAVVWSVTNLGKENLQAIRRLDLTRAEALIDLYFPELRPAVVAFHASEEAAGSQVREEMAKSLEDGSSDQVKAAAAMYAVGRQEGVHALAREVRQTLPRLVQIIPAAETMPSVQL